MVELYSFEYALAYQPLTAIKDRNSCACSLLYVPILELVTLGSHFTSLRILR